MNVDDRFKDEATALRSLLKRHQRAGECANQTIRRLLLEAHPDKQRGLVGRTSSRDLDIHEVLAAKAFLQRLKTRAEKPASSSSSSLGERLPTSRCRSTIFVGETSWSTKFENTSGEPRTRTTTTTTTTTARTTFEPRQRHFESSGYGNEIAPVVLVRYISEQLRRELSQRLARFCKCMTLVVGALGRLSPKSSFFTHLPSEKPRSASSVWRRRDETPPEYPLRSRL